MLEARKKVSGVAVLGCCANWVITDPVYGSFPFLRALMLVTANVMMNKTANKTTIVGAGALSIKNGQPDTSH